jgi:hypothetical protein
VRPKSLAKAAFFIFLARNSDFGRSGRCVPFGRIRFGSSQNPGCGAVRSDAVVLRLRVHSSFKRRQGRVRPYLAVERAGLSTLNEGQTVEYELVTNRGKTSAENLKMS